MSLSKRVLVIISLVLFLIIIFLVTKIYEKKVAILKTIEIVNNYKPFKNCSNFKLDNSERYVRYYEKNSALKHCDVVTRVNIGLDYGFYDLIKISDFKKDKLILVNKYLKLDENYIPNNLEEINSKYFIDGNSDVRQLKKEAKEAFEKLSEDSIKIGAPVYGQSAYRNYLKQESLYNTAVDNYGKEVADSDTARPGHSEHQTGFAIDVSSTKSGNMLKFEYTSSYKWMKNNAHKYGFILRYPKGKESIHGYIYEPWHYRYVGIDVATDMHENYPNLTYDEYYYILLNEKGL